MQQRKVILDCDPGHDDAFALYLLLAAETIRLEAVTLASGNQTQDKIFSNTKKLLHLAGHSDIPIGKGYEKPLMRQLVTAGNIHGASGIDGAVLPMIDVGKPDGKALDIMVEVLRKTEGKVSIVATGPLTNIAILLLAYPELHEKIELISFMGGACFGGNWSSNAEFNVYVDPDATKIVLNSGIPLAMFGLDVTMKAQFYEEDILKVKELNTPVSENFVGILNFFKTKILQPFRATSEHIEGQHLHDACAAAYLINPEIFSMNNLNVAVNTTEGLGYAQTVVDYLDKSGRSKNCEVAFDLDRDAFVSLIIASLKKIGERGHDDV